MVLTNESPVLQSDLTVVKLFGDMLIFGGKQGFVGVGSVGLTTGVAEGISRKVMYCIACKQGTAAKASENASKGSSKNMKGAIAGAYPHSTNYAITSLAAGKKQNIFAAGDSQGVISIWYLNKDDDAIKFDKSPNKTNLGFYYKIKPALRATVNLTFLKTPEVSNNTGEKIITMEFFNGDRYLVVSTTRRLLLLVLAQPVRNQANFLFLGWLELDRLSDSINSEGRFGFCVNESENRSNGELFMCATKLVHWRVSETTNIVKRASADSGTTVCSVVKTEWTSEQLMNSLTKIKYL